jgi:hypothetical protein
MYGIAKHVRVSRPRRRLAGGAEEGTAGLFGKVEPIKALRLVYRMEVVVELRLAKL